MNLLTSRLAARAQQRQVEAHLRAETAATAVDRAIGGVWADILRLLRRHPLYWQAQHEAKLIFHRLIPVSATSLGTSLHRMADWGHRTTVRALTGTLSARYLRAAAMRTMFESRAPSQRQSRRLLEKRPSQKPGIIEIGLGVAGITTADLSTLLRDPGQSELSDDEQKDLFADLLFPPPDQQTVNRLIEPWLQSLKRGQTDRSANPDVLSRIVGQGFAQGKTPQQIATDLLPAVNNSRVAARRAARTGSMYVAHQVQHRAWDGLGDLNIGFQIHATMDQHTRPAHAARNGQVYYKEPKDGQLGLDAMPHPPLEADGSMAWNCRCHTSPVLAPDPAFDDPAMRELFAANADMLIGPDPVAYGEWFAAADERRRQTAVGAKRLLAVKQITGGKVKWGHFIDPETGHLLPVAVLQSETKAVRAARLKRVNELLAKRAANIKAVRTFGFLAA